MEIKQNLQQIWDSIIVNTLFKVNIKMVISLELMVFISLPRVKNIIHLKKMGLKIGGFMLGLM